MFVTTFYKMNNYLIIIDIPIMYRLYSIKYVVEKNVLSYSFDNKYWVKFGDKTNKMTLFENPLSGNTELVIELRVVWYHQLLSIWQKIKNNRKKEKNCVKLCGIFQKYFNFILVSRKNGKQTRFSRKSFRNSK